MSRINRVIQKLQSLHFKGKMSINRLLRLPAQTRKEIRIFKKLFDDFTDNRKIKIFEWGSGFSTIYYAGYLHKKGATFEWHSIDNNESWHKMIKSILKKKGVQPYVKLYLEEFLPFWEKPGWGIIPPPCGAFLPKSENEKAYINFPMMLKENFDIVIIDARFRRHCIQTAKKVVSPNGIIVMHDAQKEHYHVGLDDFQYSKFYQSGSWYPFQRISNEIWVGSIGNSKIFEVLQQL